MKQNMDQIQFESRREIEQMMKVLALFSSSACADPDVTSKISRDELDELKDIAQELYQLLDVMHMTW